MIKDTIAILERTAPPAAGKGLSVRHNAAEIAALEKQLGLPASSFECRLAMSRSRLEILRQMAARTTVAVPAAAPVAQAQSAAQPVRIARAATPTAAVAPVLSRQQCLEIHRAVFHEAVLAGAMSDAELLASTLSKIQAERLNLPGTPKVDCTDLTIQQKAFRAIRQDGLAYVLSTVK